MQSGKNNHHETKQAQKNFAILTHTDVITNWTRISSRQTHLQHVKLGRFTNGNFLLKNISWGQMFADSIPSSHSLHAIAYSTYTSETRKLVLPPERFLSKPVFPIEGLYSLPQHGMVVQLRRKEAWRSQRGIPEWAHRLPISAQVGILEESRSSSSRPKIATRQRIFFNTSHSLLLSR